MVRLTSIIFDTLLPQVIRHDQDDIGSLILSRSSQPSQATEGQNQNDPHVHFVSELSLGCWLNIELHTCLHWRVETIGYTNDHSIFSQIIGGRGAIESTILFVGQLDPTWT